MINVHSIHIECTLIIQCSILIECTVHIECSVDNDVDSFPSRTSENERLHLGTLELPRDVGHDVDGVGAADADAEAAEAAAVGRVRVGADHQQAGERVVLQNDLVDDARAGLPEADAVLGAGRRQKVVYLKKENPVKLGKPLVPNLLWGRYPCRHSQVNRQVETFHCFNAIQISGCGEKENPVKLGNPVVSNLLWGRYPNCPSKVNHLMVRPQIPFHVLFHSRMK